MSYAFDRFILDPARRLLLADGAPRALGATPFDALTLLVERGDLMVSHDELLGVVWRGTAVTPLVIPQAIRRIRAALGDRAAAPRFVLSVRGRGYRFIAPVHRRCTDYKQTGLFATVCEQWVSGSVEAAVM